MKRKIMITTSIILVLAIAAAVYFLPWPTPVNVTFNGIEVTEEGAVLGNHDIILKGTKLNYLFKADCFKFSNIQIADNQYDTSHYSDGGTPVLTIPGTSYECIAVLAYDPKTNGNCRININLSFDRNWCFVDLHIPDYDESRYFVGSIDEDFDPKEILDTCLQAMQ